MDRPKKRKPVVFAALVTLGISFLFIIPFVFIGTIMESELFLKKSQMHGSDGGELEMQEGSDSNTGQEYDNQRDIYTEEYRALLLEQYHMEQLTASRGAQKRAEAATNDEIPSNVPTEAKPTVSAETKSNTLAHAKSNVPAPVKPAASSEAKPSEPVKPVSNNAAEAGQNIQAQANSSNELDLLARLITAEAQGEPYEAQVAVGAVVLNRVESHSWPNTVEDVIYQNIDGYYQFTPVVNGWINKPAEPGSAEAAKAALNGADPTNGAQFYYDDTTTNQWILSKPVSVKIGHMIFAF